jgi:cytochrome bd-type quinol oxidase subunit 2
VGIVAAWLTTAGLIAFTLSTVTYARTPGDHREFPVTSVLAAIAVAIGLIAIVRRQRSSRTSSSYSTAAGALVLAIWGVSAVDVLWLPILPSPTSPAAQRMLTAAVLWSAIAIATVSVATVVLNRRRRDLADASVPAEETTPSHAAGSTPITSHSAELQLLATSTGGAAALHTFSVRRFPRQRLEGYAGIRQADCPSKSREREE